MSNVESECVVS